MSKLKRPAIVRSEPAVLITGGCGFIGCNLADTLARNGRSVLILDNLCRAGTERNAHWLQTRHTGRITIETGDVRDLETVRTVVPRASAVLHLAAQVAVTTSLESPIEDFEINARGTLNVLESVRQHNPRAPVIVASTNKVYGRIAEDDAVTQVGERYVPNDTRFARGVDEAAPLDFYSPYGCSKGTADQYVRDYARVFGLRTAVIRMSCIYGPRQFGTEDQGWIAHFVLAAMRGNPITIYGDGYQVRDALYVDDAVAAWLGALEQIDAVSGRVFNLGGGLESSISLRELIGLIGELGYGKPEVRFEDWRPGDQRWYISNTRAISSALGWSPGTPFEEGLAALERWLSELVRDTERAPLREARA